jgi:hypothetical protein
LPHTPATGWFDKIVVYSDQALNSGCIAHFFSSLRELFG